MEISYNDLKSKELVNLNDGSKMGRVVDILFESDSGKVMGLVAPGEKKFFRKNDEIFIPLEKIRRIGDDVILVRFDASDAYFSGINSHGKNSNNFVKYYKNSNSGEDSFIRYKRFDNKKYK